MAAVACRLGGFPQAYRIIKERDYVPEMVFLLGRMGNSKDALMLIIERLGDVQRVSFTSLPRPVPVCSPFRLLISLASRP